MVSTLFTTRFSLGTGLPDKGASSNPYNAFNLALHVGDGKDSVLANRATLREETVNAMFMNQTHGSSIFVVDGISEMEPTADALITQVSGIGLSVLVADCIPLLLWDAQVDLIAAVHVGRRGLLNAITVKVVELMEAMGATQIQGKLGPSICGVCYEVGEDVYTQVVEAYPLTQSRTQEGKFALNLPAGLLGVLTELGIQGELSNECTAESPEYFSYRRDGITGRQAGVIWI